MAKTVGECKFKEVDNMHRKGVSAVFEKQKNTESRKKKLDQPGVKEDLMSFLFSGKDSAAVSPLQEQPKKKKKVSSEAELAKAMVATSKTIVEGITKELEK